MINRTRLFLFFFGSSLAFLYVGHRLAISIGVLPTSILLAILFAGFLMFRRVLGLQTPWLRDLLTGAIHLELAGLSFLFAFVILRDLLFLPLSYLDPQLSAQAFSFEGGLILFGFVIAALMLGSSLMV